MAHSDTARSSLDSKWRNIAGHMYFRFLYGTAVLSLNFFGHPLAQGADPKAAPSDKEALVQTLSRQPLAAGTWAQLSKKHGNRLSPLLRQIIEDKMQRDDVRWSAIFGYATTNRETAADALSQYSKDPHWVLRDASLRAMTSLGITDRAAVFGRALKDPALVVRTTAVDAVGALELRPLMPYVVDTLFESQNYRGKTPLWIHDHTLRVIERLSYKEANPKLVELLESTRDQTLRRKVISTLESLNQKSFSDRPLSEQVYLWKRAFLSERTF